MKRQVASLTGHVAVEIDINIGLLPQVLGNPGLPVARIDEIDNAQRDVIDLLLIVFAKQSPALRDAPQAMDFAQRGATRRGINPHSPAASSNKPAATSQG